VDKLTTQKRELAKSIVGMMSIKRIPDSDIIAEIKRQTNKKLSRITLYHLRQQNKKATVIIFLYLLRICLCRS
jgi:hypothetical protein